MHRFLQWATRDKIQKELAFKKAKEDVDARKAAMGRVKELRNWQNKALRAVLSVREDEKITTAAKRAAVVVPVFGALGGWGAQWFTSSVVSDMMRVSGSTEEEAMSAGETVGNIVAAPAALASAWMVQRFFQPEDILESASRTITRGIGRVAAVMALPAHYFGFKYSISGGSKGARQFLASEDPYLNSTDLVTFRGISPEGGFGLVNGSYVPTNTTAPLYLRDDLAAGIGVALPMAAVGLKLGLKMIPSEWVHIHDAVDDYSFYKSTMSYNPNPYVRLNGELGWLVTNILEGNWWSLTFLAGVYKPGMEAMGFDPWVSGLMATASKGAYETKLVKRHWLDIGAWFMKWKRGGDDAATASAVKSGKMALILNELITQTEIHMPEDRVKDQYKLSELDAVEWLFD